MMHRRYSRERYLQLIGDLKTAVPQITFTTDVMVGFPGETEKDFSDTLSLMQDVRFLEAFMYYFNPREGTKAVDMPDQIPTEIRMQRLQKLIDLQRSITHEEKKKRCKGQHLVLVEQISKKNEFQYLGRTEHDEMVVFEPKSTIAIGDFVSVELQGLVGNTFTAVHSVD
jgi:tRNA-2-methylthio-N6-dimethylallyladenosine synthase